MEIPQRFTVNHVKNEPQNPVAITQAGSKNYETGLFLGDTKP